MGADRYVNVNRQRFPLFHPETALSHESEGGEKEREFWPLKVETAGLCRASLGSIACWESVVACKSGDGDWDLREEQLCESD